MLIETLVIDGTLPNKMLDGVKAQLFDPSLHARLNGPSTWHLILFSCGRCLDLQTMNLVPNEPDMYISHSTGYPYPTDQIAEITAKLAARGIDLVKLFVEIEKWEVAQLSFEDYPARFRDLLNQAAEVEELYLLKIIYAMFENWAVTMYRGLKLPTCGLFSIPTEVFVHDRGDTGGNGKTLLQTVVAATSGDYFAAIDESMLASKPPQASAPNPALYALLGKRCLGTPEVEEGLRVQAAWVKKLADPSTLWAAREPYGTAAINFKLNSLFGISTNAKLLFTKVDGGIERRGIGCKWEFSFKKNPKPGTHERRECPKNLKDPDVLAPYIAGYYFLLECVYRAFYFSRHCTSPGRMPKAIEEATKELVHEELRDCVQEILDEDFVNTATGLSYAKIRTHIAVHPQITAMKVKMSDLEPALASLMHQGAVQGIGQTI